MEETRVLKRYLVFINNGNNAYTQESPTPEKPCVSSTMDTHRHRQLQINSTWEKPGPLRGMHPGNRSATESVTMKDY